MNPLATDSGWPHYGRDDNDHGASVFIIAAYLEILGLKRLTNNFLLWLAHYEGLERHLAEDDDPVTSVRNVLFKFVIERRRCDAENPDEVKKLVQDITHELMTLDFIHRKAFWGDDPMMPTGGKTLWNPMQQSWLSFIVLTKFVITGRRCDAENPDEVKKLVQDITHELMTLDFIHRKAFWGDDPMMPTGGKTLWNPMQQSWLSFIEHHEPGQEIWLWRGDEPHISERLLQDILLRDV